MQHLPVPVLKYYVVPSLCRSHCAQLSPSLLHLRKYRLQMKLPTPSSASSLERSTGDQDSGDGERQAIAAAADEKSSPRTSLERQQTAERDVRSTGQERKRSIQILSLQRPGLQKLRSPVRLERTTSSNIQKHGPWPS